MAKKMLNSDVMTSDAMIGSSNDAKALYMYLNLMANDDGITYQSRLAMMSSNTGIQTLEELKASGFIIELEDGAIVITDWFIHNLIVGKNYNNPAKGLALTALMITPEGRYVLSSEADEHCLSISEYRKNRADNNPRIKSRKATETKPKFDQANGKFGYYNNITLSSADLELLSDELGEQANNYVDSLSRYIQETGDNVEKPVQAILKLAETPDLEMLTAIDISNLIHQSFEEAIALSRREAC